MDSENTLMFDFASFYDKLAEKLPFQCRVCEVGIANGDSLIYLAKKLIEKGKTFKIYGVDNLDYGGYFQLKTIYENLIKNKVAEFVEIIPKASLDAVNDFNDGYLDAVFIDSSHLYSETKNEIYAWYKKVLDLGYLGGHDYNSPEVRRAVNESIPKEITRKDIPGREFPTEAFLMTEPTERNYGVWWCQKDFYKGLK